MNQPKKIFWLASYPKSGNTLFRAIISSLFFSKDGEFNNKLLNFIELFETCARLKFLEEENPKDMERIHDLKIISKYWLEMQSEKRLNLKESFCFVKTHSALISLLGNDFTNKESTRGLIYLVRDPRDIAISWSKHRNKSIDNTINFMLDGTASIAYTDRELLNNQNLKPLQYTSRWDINVKSWEFLQVPKMIIRYEDLIENKKNNIIKITEFFFKEYGFSFPNLDEKIKNILKTTDFNFMKKQEEKYGFPEALSHSRFFSVGKKNQWKNKLNLQQIKKIEDGFKEVMTKYNYL